MMKGGRTALVILWLLLPWRGSAQPSMIIEHYSQDEGLPSNIVYDAQKDRDGFVWIGTWHGLCSFDGAVFSSFSTRSNRQSDVPPQKVISIVDDDKGHLWLRNVDNRLYIFNKRTERYHEVYDELKQISQNMQVIKIRYMGGNRVLLLTRNKNLYEGTADEEGHVKLTLLHNAAYDIDPITLRLLHDVEGETSERRYWIGTDYSIDAIDKKNPRKLRKGYTTFTDHLKNVWRFENDQLLTCYHPNDGTTRRFTFPKHDRLRDPSFKDAGENGLFILMPDGELLHYNHHSGLMSNLSESEFNGKWVRFYDIFLDNDGQLWLSSTVNGLYKICFPPSHFNFVSLHFPQTSTMSFAGNGVRALLQQRNGNLWIGTRNNELLCVNPHTFAVIHAFKGDIGSIFHIMEDRQGCLWLSTKGAGLVKATPDKQAPEGYSFTRFTNDYTDKYSISSDRVYYTFQDSKDRIWVCTFGGGLNLLAQQGNQTRFYHKNNLLSQYPQYDQYMSVRTITEDKDGRLWVGTTDGLMSFAGNFKKPESIAFETYRETGESEAIDSDICTLYKDHQGSVWMGVFGGGLYLLERYDGKKHKPALKQYPFSENNLGVVSSISEDANHHLWLCTENSLATLDPHTGYIRHYDRYAGFPHVNIEDNTSISLSNGTMLIGCRQGLLTFNPSAVEKTSKNTSPLYIVDFKVQNRALSDFDPPIYEGSIRYTETLTLTHRQNMFTIEFASLNYTTQRQVAYNYILDGYEKQWHMSGSNRIASYANVPPGKYTFRVRTMDNASEERTLTIRILPPWWATWWAYCLYALLAVALLYAVARLAIYMIRMRNEVYINDRLAELKIRFFTNISHELRTPLTLIKGPIEELKKNQQLGAADKEYLNLIDNNARKMLQLVNQILDFRKVQNGKMRLHASLTDVNNMLEALHQEYRMMAQERDIAFHFELPSEHVLIWCDAQKIAIVMNNLVSNAFKFTPEGGTICVALEHDSTAKSCTIRVEDNGASIPHTQLEEIFERFSQANNHADDTSQTGTGIGLSLSREYVNMHQGRIWAENMEEGGVTFIVELPTTKEQLDPETTDIYLSDIPSAAPAAPTDSPETAETEAETAEQTDTASTTELPTILLIEDNLELCRMLSLQLKDKYTIHTANNGEEGLRKVYQYSPDIIVSDLMMPGIDGMELLRRVRKDFTISHIPVIILTAKQGEDIHMEAISAGANAYITKPFSSHLLVARINQLLEEQHRFQRHILQDVAQTPAPSERGAQPTARPAAGQTAKTAAEAGPYSAHLEQKDLDFIKRIHNIIEENLQNEDFRIEAIAMEMGISRSVFFKKLKSLTGFAPVDLVKEIRLTKAEQMVTGTSQSIAEIAYAVGFRDPGYFIKCFRQKYGSTPKEYRTTQQKQ